MKKGVYTLSCDDLPENQDTVSKICLTMSFGWVVRPWTISISGVPRKNVSRVARRLDDTNAGNNNLCGTAANTI